MKTNELLDQAERFAKECVKRPETLGGVVLRLKYDLLLQAHEGAENYNKLVMENQSLILTLAKVREEKEELAKQVEHLKMRIK